MTWIDRAIDSALELNPRVQVQDRGDWPGLGRLLNLVLPDGRQSSIVVRTGDDVAAKITETVGRFECP